MNDETSAAASGAKPSAAFWTAAVASLVWNLIGAALYLMAKLRPESILSSMPPDMREYTLTMPLWAHIGWSIGIWASLLGSFFLLMRSRQAANLFLLSGIGAVVSYAAQGMAGVLTPAQPITILVIIALQWWWAKKQVADGNMR